MTNRRIRFQLTNNGSERLVLENFERPELLRVSVEHMAHRSNSTEYIYELRTKNTWNDEYSRILRQPSFGKVPAYIPICLGYKHENALKALDQVVGARNITIDNDNGSFTTLLQENKLSIDSVANFSNGISILRQAFPNQNFAEVVAPPEPEIPWGVVADSNAWSRTQNYPVATVVSDESAGGVGPQPQRSGVGSWIPGKRTCLTALLGGSMLYFAGRDIFIAYKDLSLSAKIFRICLFYSAVEISLAHDNFENSKRLLSFAGQGASLAYNNLVPSAKTCGIILSVAKRGIYFAYNNLTPSKQTIAKGVNILGHKSTAAYNKLLGYFISNSGQNCAPTTVVESNARAHRDSIAANHGISPFAAVKTELKRMRPPIN